MLIPVGVCIIIAISLMLWMVYCDSVDIGTLFCIILTTFIIGALILILILGILISFPADDIPYETTASEYLLPFSEDCYIRIVDGKFCYQTLRTIDFCGPTAKIIYDSSIPPCIYEEHYAYENDTIQRLLGDRNAKSVLVIVIPQGSIS